MTTTTAPGTAHTSNATGDKGTANAISGNASNDAAGNTPQAGGNAMPRSDTHRSDAQKNDTQKTDSSMPTSIAGPMHAAMDHAGDAAASAAELVRESMASTRDAMVRCAEDARELGEQCAARARDTVRVKPLTAVLAALCVGLVIGRMGR